MPETRLPDHPALGNEAPRRMHILWLGLRTRHDRRQEAEGRGDRSEPALDVELEERTVGPRQARLDRRGRIVLAEKQLDPVQLSPPKPPSNRRDWRKKIRSTRFLIWILLILLI